jgi:hypothetical protein
MSTNAVPKFAIVLRCAFGLALIFVESPVVVGGSGPTAEIRITPVPLKVGVYPVGTTIVGQELRAPYGGFRAWFEVYVRNWDPDQDDSPMLKAGQVFSNRFNGWVGESANPPNPGVDLVFASRTCTSTSDCESEFGEVGPKCEFGYCKGTYESTTRSDWFCANSACLQGYCDTSAEYLRCVVVANDDPGFFHDDGTTKYLATLVLDVPLEARGTYTVALDATQTFLFDPSSEQIPIAAELSAYVVLGAGADVCQPPDSSGVPKNRALSLSIPPGSTPTRESAIRVTPVELQNPQPPNAAEHPPPDFSAYEAGPGCTDPGGCARWVGKPATFHECNPGSGGGTVRSARLQCTPHYQDWSAVGAFHVVGAEILPSSTYDVEILPDTCRGNEANCSDVSPATRLITARYGDVFPPFSPPDTSTQPDALDVAAMVDKYKCICGTSTKAQMQLEPNLPELNEDLSALDIVAAVDAFKGLAYAESGPCPCPSTVTCGSTSCASPTPCTTAFGAGATCVQTCAHGSNEGDPCLDDTNCVGGTCGGGYCRDRCGRCTP